ncbi:MAG: bacterial transcriptional activator domain-containing protein [Gammaproteobacteria bacterium]|nr:bacterial transcriptional activator domain-containing protein [Gammaproteobacteria bacterium]
MADAKFAGSPQMSAFLRYVVVEALEGNADRIKAYTVGVDALGKDTSFDPQNDPSVRVLAKRLRTALTEYYARTGNHEKIIEIRAGSYKPIFSDPVTAAEDNNAAVSTGFAGASPIASAGCSETSQYISRSESAGIGSALIDSEDDEPVPPAVSASEKLPSTAAPEIPEPSMPIAQGSAVDLTIGGALKDQPDKQAIGSHVIKKLVAYKEVSAAFIILALLTVFWGFDNEVERPDVVEQADVTEQDHYVLQLASSNGASRVRPRPKLPTVVVRTNNREDGLSKSLLSSMVHVLSKFDHFQVLNSTHDYELTEKWPEDYEIVLDALIMKDSRKLTINLANAASGEIVYSDELKIEGGFDAGLAENNIAEVNLATARIVQKDGPLLTNYKSQAKYSETMACLFSIKAYPYKAETNENCISIDDNGDPVSSSLRAELSLSRYLLEGEGNKQEALKEALRAVKNNLELVPHSADAHALAMRAYQSSGDLDTALNHGRIALGINELDSRNTRAFSLLLTEMNQLEEAELMQKKARMLSASSPDISL